MDAYTYITSRSPVLKHMKHGLNMRAALRGHWRRHGLTLRFQLTHLTDDELKELRCKYDPGRLS